MKIPKHPLLALIQLAMITRFGNVIDMAVPPRGAWRHPTKSGPGRMHGRVDGTKKRTRRSKIHRACMAGRANDHIA